MHQLQVNNKSLLIPDSWLKIKLETEYLEPQALEQSEINAIALGASLGNLSANPSFAVPKFPNPRGLNTKQAVFQNMIQTLLVQPHLFRQKNHGIKISAFVERIEQTSWGTSILTNAVRSAVQTDDWARRT